MQETEDFQPERHRFFVTWLPLQGAFARELEYKGPPGSLPFFITPALDPSPPGGSGAYNLWQLQQGLVFCWNKEPHGAVNIPKASRRRILRRLGEVDGHGLALAVVEVNVHVFDRIGFDEGLDCAVNGLDICKGAPDYARLFLDTVVSYAPLLDGAASETLVRRWATHGVRAISGVLPPGDCLRVKTLPVIRYDYPQHLSRNRELNAATPGLGVFADV